MMTTELSNVLNIRYIKLHFTIQFAEDTIMPKNKVSALRGGMGEMLLRANCIRERKCESCDFETECIVQRTMYSKFEKKPDFITSGDSIGYVLECENYQEEFCAGETLQFNLILFGKTIVYFSQYMNAFYALGTQGVGKNYSKFYIISVTNNRKEELLINNNIYMKNYKVQTVKEYVEYRIKQLENKEILNILVFKTPLALKYQNELLFEFNAEAIMRAVKRRIYMLDCFENIEGEEYYTKNFEIPNIIKQESSKIKVKRYSSRQDSKMVLSGIEGYAEFESIDRETLCLLLAGELIHIGRNTSFGFGRYRVN